MDYDAELHDYVFVDGSYCGKIMNDSKGRFEDGTYVMTSTVKSKKGDIVFTRNTKYKLVNAERV